MVRRALVIANSQYDDEHFPPLPAAAADAAALTSVLSDPAIGEFTVDQVIDGGQRVVTRAIESFFASASADDLLLLHLSLHGWKDVRNRLVFVVQDTERKLPHSTAVSAVFVSDCMSQSRSSRIVVLLDCCYSGAFTAGMLRRSTSAPQVDVAEPFAGKGRMVITASTSLQFAHEDAPDLLSSRVGNQPSVFTSAIVQGLRDGSADLDHDGLISVGELYEYVYEQVRQQVPGQTPTLSVDSAQGAIYVARGPSSSDSGVLAELRDASDSPQAWARVGALHLIGRLLGSVREPVRQAAQDTLLALVADDDPEVAGRARQLWHARGLGDIPAREKKVSPVLRTEGSLAVGIDFGTTNSAISVYHNGEVRVIPNAEGLLTTPSVVALTADGEVLVGAAAKRQATVNASYTVFSVKLKLGTEWNIERGGKLYSAEEIAAFTLSRLSEDVKAYTGRTVTNAVLTVPAYFDYVQRHALMKAAEIAGIAALRIINEPTAAAMAYGLNRTDDQIVLMVDLGGGTFDVCLLDISEGICYVLATAGDNSLGGDNWDEQLTNHLVRLIDHHYGIDASHDVSAIQRIKEAAEMAKIDLSAAQRTDIHLPYIASGASGPVHLDTALTRAEFEAITRDTLNRCKAPIRQVMEDASDWAKDVTHVVLVGGATRMPAVGRLVRELTGGKLPYRGLIPEGIVSGAALQAGVLKGLVKDVLLLDVVPLSLGVETEGGIFTKMIQRNTTIPTKRSEIFITSRDNQNCITIRVVEGESEIAQYNRTVAIFKLKDLIRAPKGAAQIEITFDVDANGLLRVDAKDLGSGRSQSLVVNRDAAVDVKRWPAALEDLPSPGAGPPASKPL